MKFGKVSTMALAVVMIAACFAPLIGNTGNVDGDDLVKPVDRLVPQHDDGYIWINDVEGLKAIGTDVNNPMNGNYVLGKDITFTSGDGVGSVISMTISISGDTMTVSIPTAVSGVVFLDSERVNITYGNASFGYDASKEYVLTVGGNDGTNNFAYSMNIPKAYVPSNPVEFNSNGNFIPVGTTLSPFNGTFNGNGYKINGMEIAVYSSTSEISAGMFAYVSDGKINNLIMEEGKSTIVSTYQGSVSRSDVIYAGNIVGNIINATDFTIENCYSSNDLVVAVASEATQMDRKNMSIGGLIGYAGTTSSSTTNLTVKDCINAGDVIVLLYLGSKYMAGNYAYSGGIVGHSDAKTVMTDSQNKGTVTASFNAVAVSLGGNPRPSSYIGGLIGFIGVEKQIAQSFTRCSNSGDVSSVVISSTLFTTTSYSIHASQYVAGILGFTSPLAVTKFDGCSNNAEVTGTLTAATSFGQTHHSLYVGGLCNVNGATVNADLGIDMNDCHNTGNITAESNSSKLVPEPVLSGYVAAGGLLGSASSSSKATGCYNEGDVTAISKINCDKETTHPTYAGGLMASAYWSGKTTTIQASYNTGNVTLTSDRTINALNRSQKLDQYVGGLVADAYYLNVTESNNIGKIMFDSVSDTSTGNANVSISAYIGGIAGRTYNTATISKAYNEGEIDVSNVTSISTTGERVEDYTTVGGILGRAEMYAAKITDCYNRGNINASFDSNTSTENIGRILSVGGILGYSGFEVGESVFDPTSSVTNCYNVGKLTANSENVETNAGGIIGTADNTGKIRGTITFSYFLENWVISNGSVKNELAGLGSVKADPGYTGTLTSGSRTSQQMRDKNTFFNANEKKGWNFTPGTGIWKINPLENEGHPYLNKEKDTTYTVQLFVDDPAAYNIAEIGSFGTDINTKTYFTFSVTLNEGHQGPVTVKKNGLKINPYGGNNYKVIGTAGEVVAIDVTGATLTEQPTNYTVRTPSADVPEAYVITATGTYGFDTDVPVGTDFTFSVTLNEGYAGSITVKKNGSPMIGDGTGNFVVTNASANDIVAIEVSGATIINPMFSVLIPTVDVANAYIITSVNYGFNAMVPVGTDFMFTVALSEGYEGMMFVKQSGTEIHPVDGVYAVTGSAGDVIAISVEGAIRSTSTYYVVTLPSQSPSDAYIVTTANYGFGQAVPVDKAFTFKIELTEGYVGKVIVTSGGVIINENNGEYSVSGSAGEIVSISISGAFLNSEEPSGSGDVPDSSGDGKNRNPWWFILLLVIIVTSVSMYLLYKDDKRKK